MWRAGKPQDDFDFPSISDYLVEDDTLVWCDIYDPDHAILKDLAQELSLNSWAVEDAIAEAERTKAVVYRTHTFFTVYGVTTREPADETQSMLDIHRISGFVLPRGLITVRLSPHFDIDAVSQRFDELGGQEYGVGSLVHGLLDVVVDGHFEAVQALDEGIESIEDDLFENNIAEGPAAQDVPSAQGSRRTAAGGAADAGGRQLHPASPAGRQDRAGAGSAVFRPVRPCAAGVGVDRVVAGHGHDGVRDEPVAAGCAAEHGDEEADGLGGDHRGADRDHRLLRAERRVSGINTVGGFGDEHVDHRADACSRLYWMFRRRDWL